MEIQKIYSGERSTLLGDFNVVFYKLWEEAKSYGVGKYDISEGVEILTDDEGIDKEVINTIIDEEYRKQIIENAEEYIEDDRKELVEVANAGELFNVCMFTKNTIEEQVKEWIRVTGEHFHNMDNIYCADSTACLVGRCMK